MLLVRKLSLHEQQFDRFFLWKEKNHDAVDSIADFCCNTEIII